MKKSIIIAAVLLATGIMSSCTKDNSVKPASATTVYNNGQDPKNLGSGDNNGQDPKNLGSGDGH